MAELREALNRLYRESVVGSAKASVAKKAFRGNLKANILGAKRGASREATPYKISQGRVGILKGQEEDKGHQMLSLPMIQPPGPIMISKFDEPVADSVALLMMIRTS